MVTNAIRNAANRWLGCSLRPQNLTKKSHIIDAERAMTIPLPNLFGIDIPSDSPLFLTVLGFHVLAALIAVVTESLRC